MLSASGFAIYDAEFRVLVLEPFCTWMMLYVLPFLKCRVVGLGQCFLHQW